MFAKVALLCAVFAAAHASPLLGLSTGVSSSSRQQDGLGNYAFNYGIGDGIGATNSRAEVGDAHGNKKGFYTINDVDGRARRVDYVADSLGFRVNVNTNEPGTALSAPAAAAIVSPYAAPVAPVAAPVAPVVAAAPVAAYSSVIGHAAPISYSSVIGQGTPIGYNSVIGHGIGSPLGLGLYGAPLGRSLIW